MTIEQLKYVLAICEHSTFSQAAFEINITQSALSKQIAKLENELNIIIFDRQHRQITLTNEGSVLITHIQTLMKDYALMMDDIAKLKESLHNTIKIAMLPILAHFDLGKKLRLFSQLHPSIHLQLNEIEERDIQNKRDYHDHDLYLLRGVVNELSSYKRLCLYEDQLVALVNIHHPLAKKEKLFIRELEKEPLLFMPHYTSIFEIALKSCQIADIEPIIKRHGRLETLVVAVENQEGIALIMKNSLSKYQIHDVVQIPFEEAIHGDIYLYYDEQSKHLEEIMNLVAHLQST